MTNLSYQEIVRGLDHLEPAEIRMLLLEIGKRMRAQPKRRLAEYKNNGPLNPPGDDWVGKLRQEWDD